MHLPLFQQSGPNGENGMGSGTAGFGPSRLIADVHSFRARFTCALPQQHITGWVPIALHEW